MSHPKEPEKIKNKKKWCPRCKDWVSLTLFYKQSRNTRRRYSVYCRPCTLSGGKKYRRKYNNSLDSHNILTVSLTRLYCGTVGNCVKKKRKNIPRNISIPYLREIYAKQAGKCYYTNVVMSLKTPTYLCRDPLLISIDRIDSSKGYIKGNIALCCLGINYLKGEHNQELLYMCLKKFYEGAKQTGKII